LGLAETSVFSPFPVRAESVDCWLTVSPGLLWSLGRNHLDLTLMRRGLKLDNETAERKGVSWLGATCLPCIPFYDPQKLRCGHRCLRSRKSNVSVYGSGFIGPDVAIDETPHHPADVKCCALRIGSANLNQRLGNAAVRPRI